MKKTLIHLHHTVWISLILFLMLAALLFSVARLSTPWLAEQKPLLERWAAALLERPVKIEQLSIHWQDFEPVVRGSNVVILSNPGAQPLLKVRELDIGINLLKSVFSGHLRLGHLHIYGLHLTAHSDAAGHIHISGIDTPALAQNPAAQNAAMDEIIAWLFSEPALSLQDVTLTWYDKNNSRLPLTDLDFNINNQGSLHTVWGRATLQQQALISRLAFKLKIKGDWASPALSAKVYLQAKNLLLPQWAAWLNLASVKVNKGLVDIQLWGEWRRQGWQNWQSLFNLNKAAFSYVPSNIAPALKSAKVIALRHASGSIIWQREKDGGWKLSSNKLQINFTDKPWSLERLALTVDANNLHQHLQLNNIDLAQLTPVLLDAQLLPPAWQNTWQQLQPKGSLQDIEFDYRAAAKEQPAHFLLSTAFQHLSFAHYENRPGAVNLSGRLQLSSQAGALQLNSQKAQLDFAPMFRAPLRLNTLIAQVNWRKTTSGWSIKARQLLAKNADADINAQLSLFIPAEGKSPYLSLLAGYQLFGVQHLRDYLPLTLLKPALLKWLESAILRIAHAQGTLLINGNLKEFPFEHGNGTFMASSQIEDADIAYWPQWPRLQHASGELLFSGPAMEIFLSSGRIYAAQVQAVAARIENLKKGVPSTLQIAARIAGDLSDALKVLRESPLRELLKNGADDLQASGPLQLKLGMAIPLAHTLPLRVQGQIDTHAAIWSLPRWKVQLSDFKGQLNFSEAGLKADNLTAILWQKPVTLQILSLPKAPGMQIQMRGEAAVKDLQKQFNSPLLNALSGAAAYTVKLDIAGEKGEDSLRIQSDLKGIAIKLPAPLAKTAAQARPFALSANVSGAQPFSRISVDYGDLSAAMHKHSDAWLLDIDSPFASGNVLFPEAEAAPIQANFQRLYLTAEDSAASSIKSLRPQSLPTLYFNCRDFRYAEKKFGAVTLDLKALASGVAITQLRAEAPTFIFNASGGWYQRKDRSWTSLTGVINSQNIADTLANWGVPITGFSAKNSQANFALQWLGAPYEFALKNLNGKVALHFKEGQIADIGADNQIKMNMGRLLTIMSWQSISRRLHLDFSDLTQKGYSFNSLKGDFMLANGDAITRNTYLDGPMARVAIKGRIGLIAEDFAMHVGVTTHLSSSLTLLASIAGGPLAGIATGAVSWLADKAMNDKFNPLAADNYYLSGPWHKPLITPIVKP